MLAQYPGAIRRAIEAYIYSGYIAALIGLYQFLSYQWDWFYPSDVLFSRPEVRDVLPFLRRYYVNGLSLTQTYGSFSEPSFFAQFLLGSTLASFNWWFRGNAPLKVKGLAVISLAALIMTMSTTAYVGLGCGLVLVLGRFVMKRRARAVPVLCVLAMAATGVTVWALYGSEAEAISRTTSAVADLVLMHKTESQSYSIRLAVDSLAFQDLVETGGLGVGWGSTRGSSLLFHLLGNVGVWGVALLAWFASRVKYKLARAEPIPARTFIGLALIGNLLGGLIAVPDIISPTIWLLLGILIAMAVTQAKQPKFGVQLHPSASCTFGPASHFCPEAISRP
jgi:hypothetical protein